jgi:ketosteroid isomerase-like protein
MDLPVDIVRAYNEALFAGRANGAALDAIGDFLTEDTVCMESPTVPWGGTWVGPEGFAQMFSASDEFARSHGGRDYEVSGLEQGYWSDGPTVFHRIEISGKRASGAEVSATILELYRVDGDKIASVEVFFFDPATMVG